MQTLSSGRVQTPEPVHGAAAVPGSVNPIHPIGLLILENFLQETGHTKLLYKLLVAIPKDRL